MFQRVRRDSRRPRGVLRDPFCFYKCIHYTIKISKCFKLQTLVIRYKLLLIPNEGHRSEAADPKSYKIFG